MSRSEHTESLGLATASVDHRIDLVFIWDTLSQNELTFSMRLLIRYPFVMMGNNKQQKGKQRKQGDGERLRRGSMNTGRAGEARAQDPRHRSHRDLELLSIFLFCSFHHTPDNLKVLHDSV